MKRIIQIGLLMLVLSFGFSKTTNAEVQECTIYLVTCASGSSQLIYVCGGNQAQRDAQAQIYGNFLCSN